MQACREALVAWIMRAVPEDRIPQTFLRAALHVRNAKFVGLIRALEPA